MGHPSIGLLESNAACVRLLSEPQRYGHPRLAETLLLSAVRRPFWGVPIAARNLAALYAVQGDAVTAADILPKAIAAVDAQAAEQARAGGGRPLGLGCVDAVEPAACPTLDDVRDSLRALQVSLEVRAPLIAQWAAEAAARAGGWRNGLVAGAAAQARLAALGVPCTLQLPWD